MIPLVPLLAALENPAMLAWLAGAAAPILIHLLSRRRYKEAPWAAMEYLLAAMRASARKIRIEQWILLAIRTIVIVLLVFAVAKPMFEGARPAIGAGERVHRVFVIDNSMSMGHGDEGATRFDEAKKLAAAIVRESREGDGFSLLLMQTPPRVVVGSPVFDASQFVREIDRLSLRHGRSDLPSIVAALERVLDSSRNEHPGLQREIVYWMSDMSAHAWRPGLTGAALEEFQEQSRRLARAAEFSIVDLGGDASTNAAIADVRIDEPFVTVGREVELHVDMLAFGDAAPEGRDVELWIDGRRAARQDLEFVEGSAVATFTHRFEAPGEHRVEARLSDDALAIDNHRWRIVPVQQTAAVLCIDGAPAPDRMRGATGYLASALELESGPAVRVDVAPESALLARDLRAYDCVFLANVRRFTSREADVLRNYLAGGGGLIYFLGAQVEPENYNRILGRDAAAGADGGKESVLPAQLAEQVIGEPSGLDPLGYVHPLLAVFRGQDATGLLNSTVSGYFRLRLPADGESRVALATSGGDPLIVERRVGLGRAVMVATSADASWTTLPVRSAYVPIVQELLALAARDVSDDRNARVGDVLSGSLLGLSAAARVTLQPPGSPELAYPAVDVARDRWSFAGTDVSGIYEATFADGAAAPQAFAVNVDTVESDLAKLTHEELSRDVWPDTPFTYAVRTAIADDAPQTASDAPGLPYRWLLVAVVALLLVESVYAMRVGRRRG